MAITDITKPMALDETLQGTNTKMDAVIQKLQGIIDALGLDTSVYKPKGNITCAALIPALLIDDNLGNVYNVTDNGTTTSDFVEGAGKPIHVGDNVAIVDIGTGGQSEYKFDLLAGMVDLTNYVQKSATPGLLKNDGTVDTKDYAEKVSGATNGNLAGLNGQGNPTDSGWNGAKDTTSISGNPISISGLKANQLAKDPIITLEPIQAGSGTPSPSNIRAISGYDKVEVESCGKNLFDPSKAVSGYISNNTGALQPSSTSNSTDFIRIKSSTTYKRIVGSGLSGNYGAIYDANKDFISGLNGSQETFTTQSNAAYVRFTVNYDNGNTNWRTNVTLTEDTTATAYIPYHKATSISESLGQTVYGLELTVRTGEGKITRKDADLSTFTWSYRSTYQWWVAATAISGGIVEGTEIYEKYEHVGYVALVGDISKIGAFIASNGTISIRNGSSSEQPSGKIVYEPTTKPIIQLTPHEISLLKDYAYVSTNGTSITLAYHNGELASLGDVAQVGETVNNVLNNPSILDVTSKFVANSDNVYSTTLKAFRMGRIVFITGTFHPNAVSTFQNKSWFAITDDSLLPIQTVNTIATFTPVETAVSSTVAFPLDINISLKEIRTANNGAYGGVTNISTSSLVVCTVMYICKG